MLRWQPQRLPERTQFLSKIVGVSVALHVTACLLLFFYQANGGKISFNTKHIARSDVIVKVLPFGQKKPVAATVAAGGSGKSGAVVGKTGKKKGLKTSVVKQQKAKPVDTKKKSAKQVSKKTALATKKEAAKKQTKQSKKELPVKAAQQAAAVKPEQAPVAPVAEQPVQQQTVPEVKAAEIPAAVQQEASAVVDAGASGQPVTASGQEIMYVTQDEVADIEVHRLLTEALTQAWHPPVGVPAHIECQALLTVDWQGNLASYTLTQTSGIMIYDVSVEEGIKALTFPRAVWGKTIELIFKPWAES